MLTVDIKNAEYSERPAVIRDIKCSVGTGELVGLIGPNGTGKSSTIKGILGILNNFEGSTIY